MGTVGLLVQLLVKAAPEYRFTADYFWALSILIDQAKESIFVSGRALVFVRPR